jgi:prepilin-type N-terminal cleavage/methylation domain-containing protein
MNRCDRKIRAGFTLIELMIAMTMLSIVVILTLDSLTRQQKTSIVTEQIVEAQQNVRAVSSLIEREIRMAGFMVPNAVGVCGIDSTTGPDQIFVSETDPIVPDDSRAGDLGARLSAPWSGATVLGLDSTTTDLDGDGTYFYDNDGNGTGEADFRVGGGFILADAANPHRGVVCGTVTAASSTGITIVIVGGSLAALVLGDAEEDAVIVPAAHYAINTGVGTGRLERNGDLLTQGIDDLQISYFFDVDDDGVIDSAAAEEPGTSGGAVYNATNWDNSTLKEIRFSLVMRTRATDVNYNRGSFIANENRVAPVSPTTDGFRRRVLIGAVRPRNIGNSGSI